MKKYLFVSFIFAALMACNSNDSKETKEEASSKEEKKDPTADLSSNPDYEKGLQLIAQSDCLTCHKVGGEERIQGPAYWEVANRYANSSRQDTVIEYLAQKIIKGGSGNWAETPLMTPHPGVPVEDAKAMVKYILLLKK